MKKIYIFTLEEINVDSDKLAGDLRIIAHMLYHQILNYNGINNTPLNINKNIKYNNLCEDAKISGVSYYFDSDIIGDCIHKYEPFVIRQRSFGLTINDEMMSEKVLYELVDYVLKLTNLNYSFTIDSECYFASSKDDERNRLKAIKKICKRLGYRYKRRVGFARKLINNRSGHSIIRR